MKIYISGPITGVEGFMERFARAEETLTAEGHIVINPARVNAELPEDTTHEEYMNMSFAMMDMCEAVFMLKDWKQSIGARMEVEYALNRGHTIIFEGEKECTKQKQDMQKPENLTQKPDKKLK